MDENNSPFVPAPASPGSHADNEGGFTQIPKPILPAQGVNESLYQSATPEPRKKRKITPSEETTPAQLPGPSEPPSAANLATAGNPRTKEDTLPAQGVIESFYQSAAPEPRKKRKDYPRKETTPTQLPGPSESPSAANLPTVGNPDIRQETLPQKRAKLGATMGNDYRPREVIMEVDGQLFVSIEREWVPAIHHSDIRTKLIMRDAQQEGAPVWHEGMSEDYTSYSPIVHSWTKDLSTIKDRHGRAVFSMDTPPEDWVHNPRRRHLMEGDLVVLDPNHRPLKDFPWAPLTISTRISPWLAEGLRRVFGMTFSDMRARMINVRDTFSGDRKLQVPSAFSNRWKNWRLKTGLETWMPRKRRTKKAVSDQPTQPAEEQPRTADRHSPSSPAPWTPDPEVTEEYPFSEDVSDVDFLGNLDPYDQLSTDYSTPMTSSDLPDPFSGGYPNVGHWGGLGSYDQLSADYGTQTMMNDLPNPFSGGYPNVDFSGNWGPYYRPSAHNEAQMTVRDPEPALGYGEPSRNVCSANNAPSEGIYWPSYSSSLTQQNIYPSGGGYDFSQHGESSTQNLVTQPDLGSGEIPDYIDPRLLDLSS